MLREVTGRTKAGADVANPEVDPTREARKRTMVSAFIMMAVYKRFELRFMNDVKIQRFSSPKIFISPLCQKIVTSADNGEVGGNGVLRQFRTLLYLTTTSSSTNSTTEQLETTISDVRETSLRLNPSCSIGVSADDKEVGGEGVLSTYRTYPTPTSSFIDPTTLETTISDGKETSLSPNLRGSIRVRRKKEEVTGGSVQGSVGTPGAKINVGEAYSTASTNHTTSRGMS
jgi:hypothetical protein